MPADVRPGLDVDGFMSTLRDRTAAGDSGPSLTVESLIAEARSHASEPDALIKERDLVLAALEVAEEETRARANPTTGSGQHRIAGTRFEAASPRNSGLYLPRTQRPTPPTTAMAPT